MSILPANAEIGEEVTFESYPTKTWKYDPATGRLSGFTDELDALRQTVEIILNIRRFRWPIYSGNVGHEMDAVGYDPDTAKVRLQTQIQEALLADDRITGVNDFSFLDGQEPESMLVSFTVSTIFGDLRMEAIA